MELKKKYGQFYTTNYEYILQDFKIPENIDIIEPFCGNGDLLKLIKDLPLEKKKLECYDIEPKHSFIIKRDTLKNPPNYNNKFVLTNHPYLARNKSQSKEIFNKYKTNDLYKCFIKELLLNYCKGGILILPLNFFCSIRKTDTQLRKDFLKIYSIVQLSIFEEKVFQDTTQTICSFLFIKEKKDLMNVKVYPEKKEFKYLLNESNNYSFGGEILKNEEKLFKSLYKITRLTKNNKNEKNTNLLVKCLDDTSTNQIQMKYIENERELYIDETKNLTARSYLTLVIYPVINEEKQRMLANKFNEFLNHKRKETHSLFLTSYREYDRKRISFDCVYSITKYLLEFY